MLSILLQTENLNNLTESVNKVTDSSIRIAQAANDFGAFVMHGIDSLFNKKNGTDIPGQALYFINKMEARKWVKKY